jgi:hypothetical protein
MGETPVYEVYAVKYARHERRASANFLGGDPHDGPMPIDYIPGHDPLVLERYPAAGRGLDGIAVRLDADPLR